MFRLDAEAEDAVAQYLAQLAADRGHQRGVRFGKQRLVLHAAQKRAEDSLARRGAAEELAMDKRAGQHGAALAGRNQKSEAVGQVAELGFVIDQIHSDGG